MHFSYFCRKKYMYNNKEDIVFFPVTLILVWLFKIKSFLRMLIYVN